MSRHAQKGRVWGPPTLLGIPFDANSSYLRGAAGAPPVIRAALRCEASNLSSEIGVDLAAEGAFRDAGDLSLPEKDAFPRTRGADRKSVV